MDFMFEDDVDEVGSDVEAYCPKCKADTTHVVISKYEDEIRRVQCNPCGDVHSFRKPRGEAEEDMPEPVAARKRALLKKLTWEEFFGKHGEKNPKPYEFRETYRENAIVFHPKFGKGYVSEVVSESKVEITFADARRILVHNRKDIPGSPVGREDDGLPSTAPAPKASGKAAKAAEKAGEKVVDKSGKAAEKAAKPASKPAAAPKAAAAPSKPEAKKGDEKKAAPAKVPPKKVVETKKVPAKKAEHKPEAKSEAKSEAKKAAAKKVVVKKAAPKPAKAKKPAPKKKHK